MSIPAGLREWLDRRAGIETAVRKFLYEDIPGSSGWAQVFGGIAAFLFLVQVFTGILLALNYAPTPGDAYNSVQYIMSQVPLGKFIRGLHYWGANVLIVVVALHLVQVFVFGAYHRPREATWIVGVLLLLFTLAFGLTGYLLPWDNRAFWGTVVTTQIAHKTPALGAYLDRLLGGEGGVGVVTFARFFGLHALFLPTVTAALILFHIYLVRRHGVAPAPGDTAPPKKFFPEQAARDVAAMFAAFVITFVLAGFITPPLERIADPTDTRAVPRPAWYFLFLYQSLKVFKGPLEPVGSVLLPAVAVLLLLLVPFIDRRPVAGVNQRVVALGLVALAAMGWTGLTVAAIATTPAPAPAQAGLPASPHDWRSLSAEEMPGIGYFREERCSSCHNLSAGPPKIGPNLAGVRERKSAEWMIAHFKNPPRIVPGSGMPPIDLDTAQLSALSAFLLKLTPANASLLASAPALQVQRAQVYVSSGCANCHSVNGVGMKVGPSLNGVSKRHPRAWVEKHFEDPPALSPGSVMPAYKFTPAQMNAIVTYLFSLPDTATS